MIKINKKYLMDLHINGLSINEISKKLNIPIGKVRKIILDTNINNSNDNEFNNSLKNIIKVSEKNRYQKTKEWMKEYYKSDKGKEKLKKSQKKYTKSNKGKEVLKKSISKRQRELGFIPLNKIQKGYDGHHIDKKFVIYIPSEIHSKYGHRQNNHKLMIIINKIAWEYLYLKPNNINEDNLKEYKHI